jgi:hypothetical protein
VYDCILVGCVDTSHGADAATLGADLARLTGAEVVLASIVPAVRIEHLGKRSGDAVVHTAVDGSPEARDALRCAHALRPRGRGAARTCCAGADVPRGLERA